MDKRCSDVEAGEAVSSPESKYYHTYEKIANSYRV